MTDQTTGDPTHGLSVQHADALWDAVAIPGPTAPTFPMQHERVCRAVAEILAELTPAVPAVPVSSPPPDQTAELERLRTENDRMRHELEVMYGGAFDSLHPAPPACRAALIAATVRACATHLRDTYSDTWTADAARSLELNAARIERGEPTALLRRLAAEAPQPETPNAARAAVYREVADRLTTDAHGMQPDWARIYKRDAAVKVREWAEQLDGEGRPTKKLPAS